MGLLKLGALDLALTKIGWARSRPTDRDWAGLIHPQGRGVPRLQDGLKKTVSAMRGARVVLIEGYSYQSEYSRAHSIGEMGGVVRLGLYQMQPKCVIVEIPPKTLKKFACNNGNANKDMMIEAARDQLKYGRFSDDEADALWLLQAGKHHYNVPGRVSLPAEQVAALQAVEWPDLPFEGPHLEF